MFAVGPAVRTTLGRTVPISLYNLCTPRNGLGFRHKLLFQHRFFSDKSTRVTVRPSVVRTAGPTANIAGVPVIVEYSLVCGLSIVPFSREGQGSQW